MRPKDRGPKSTRELFRGLAEGIRGQALRPNIYGYQPHDRQINFHTSSARKRLFIGGNRSGKTVGGATESIWWLAGRHPYIQTPKPPVYGRCVSVDFINGVEKIVKPEVTRWMPVSDLVGDSWETAYDKEERMLHLKNGSFLEFMSMDQPVAKFAGTSRHFIWFDEEPPRDIYVECMLRLVDTEGSFWMTLTPLDGMSSWIYDELYLMALEDSSIHVVTVDMEDNPHINWGEADAILSGLSKDEYEARKKGKFVQIGGLIYKMFSRDLHVIDEIPIPMEWLHVASMDHGFNNPTAWIWAGIGPDGQIVIYDEWYKSGEIVSVHAKKVHEKNKEHRRIPDYYVGDPSIRNVDPITGTSVLLEYMDHGIPIVLGNNDQKAGINKVASKLIGTKNIPSLYICRNCIYTIREIGRLRWATWHNKKVRADKNVKEEQHKKDDHAADAVRYLVASRPELDTGTEIPEPSKGSRGYSEAVKAEGRIDDELVSVQESYSDQHLGDEY